MLVAINGNNTMKQVDESFKFGSAREDSWQLPDPYELDILLFGKGRLSSPSSIVQVSNAIYPDLKAENEDNGGIAWLNKHKTQELQACDDTCVDQWRAAGPESKKMFSFFAVSGIFLAVCCHGHLLAICDMQRSGELMKYPLAIINKLMDEFGLDLCVAYDIMCTFFKTMLQSQWLGQKVKKMHLKGVIPLFYGHAHNWKCQLSWHLQYYKSIGSITQLATSFYRHQTVIEHFNFNNQDKHAGAKPPEMSHAIEYAELLEKFWAAKNVSDTVHEEYLTMMKNPSGYSQSQYTYIDTWNHTSFQKFEIAQEALLWFEDKHPHECWTK
uniref:Uncharacterized protein n=1 Tax=Moniliophthora roreri TaxID=221103 RepID=A0A0W0FIW6_MONRR